MSNPGNNPLCRALALTALVLAVCSSVAFAESRPNPDASRWTAHGFDVSAPASMWPMLELLHAMRFDWELASAGQRPTPLIWSDLPAGVFAQYDRSTNVISLSSALQASSVEARTAFLAHELTHLNDDLNGRLADRSSGTCYAAETRALVNEANFWSMAFGPSGKLAPDPIEARENTRMWAFSGNQHFADVVVRTTPSYLRQCGVDQ